MSCERTRRLLVPRLGYLALALTAACNSNQKPDRTLPVKLTEFSITPASFEVQSEDRLLFQINNIGLIDHNFTVIDPEGNLLGNLDINSGDVEILEFKVGAENLKIFCDIPGHEQLGMVASITIEK